MLTLSTTLRARMLLVGIGRDLRNSKGSGARQGFVCQRVVCA